MMSMHFYDPKATIAILLVLLTLTTRKLNIFIDYYVFSKIIELTCALPPCSMPSPLLLPD